MGLFTQSQSRGTEMPCLTARTLLGRGKQRKIFFICLVPVRFMLQVPRDRPASRVYIPFPNTDWVSVGEQSKFITDLFVDEL